MRVVLVMTGIIGLVVGGLVYFQALSLEQVQRVWHPATPATAIVSPPPAAVPVVVAAARTEDVPIYLSGIGTVQAYNTVNVQTQVDGQISQILFREGQDVKAGDKLVIIDPRPYQAQLQQQIAARLRD
jgi:membrane fusion protein, multidrug efflux system